MHQENVFPPERPPTLITVSEVAKLLQVSTRTVWRLLSAGKIVKPIRVGGARRWRYDDVKRWIDAGCPSSTPPNT